MAFFERNTEGAVDYVKTLIPVGCLFDIQNGEFLQGIHGNMILSGGVNKLNGVVGKGNTFKSTLMIYLALTAMKRAHPESCVDHYDTESNTVIAGLERLSRSYTGEDWIGSRRWLIKDSASVPGEKFYDAYKDFMEDKIKNRKKFSLKTQFQDGYEAYKGNNGVPIEKICPTALIIDSLTRFTTSDVIKMSDDNLLGESGGNTIFARQGLQKKRLITEIDPIAKGSETYVFMVNHVTNAPPKIGGNPNLPPPKTLQHLPSDVVIKGGTSDYLFSMDNCWYISNSSILKNDADRTALYPRNKEDRTPNDKDLNIIRVNQLRTKSGPSGDAFEVIVSQKEGVLPSLTEFHFLKTNKYYGLVGSAISYHCVLYPDVTLSRTEIRGLLDSDPKLRRAINILSEYLQMRIWWVGKLPTKYYFKPEELKEKIEQQGYSWDMILTMTRGYWSYDVNHPLLELSTMDILRMALGEYHPYWLEADKKTIKKEYQHHVKHLNA